MSVKCQIDALKWCLYKKLNATEKIQVQYYRIYARLLYNVWMRDGPISIISAFLLIPVYLIGRIIDPDTFVRC